MVDSIRIMTVDILKSKLWATRYIPRYNPIHEIWGVLRNFTVLYLVLPVGNFCHVKKLIILCKSYYKQQKQNFISKCTSHNRNIIFSTQDVRRKRGSYGLKISDLVDYTRLLLGLVSYFFRFRSFWPVFGISR